MIGHDDRSILALLQDPALDMDLHAVEASPNAWHQFYSSAPSFCVMLRDRCDAAAASFRRKSSNTYRASPLRYPSDDRLMQWALDNPFKPIGRGVQWIDLNWALLAWGDRDWYIHRRDIAGLAAALRAYDIYVKPASHEAGALLAPHMHPRRPPLRLPRRRRR